MSRIRIGGPLNYAAFFMAPIKVCVRLGVRVCVLHGREVAEENVRGAVVWNVCRDARC